MAITNKVKIGALVALATVFLIITVGVLTGAVANFDLAVINYIYSLRNPAATIIMRGISSISSTPFTGGLVALAIIAFWIKKQRKTAVFFGATMLASVIANNAIKYAIHRYRPDIAPLEDASFYSFPSGHSMNSLVFYGLLLYLAHRTIKNKFLLLLLDSLAIIFVAVIGFSRVYLGAHYPTDVIAGFLAGGCVLFAAIIIGNRRDE